MRIAFVVNDIKTELPGYTTTHLAMAATNLGHEAWYISVSGFSYDTDENVHAKAVRVSRKGHRSTGKYLDDLWSGQAVSEYINAGALDVLMLRNDPAEDAISRPWARLAGVNFARFAARKGVLVINDPEGLMQAMNKLYLQQFPSEVRPRALITRDRERIKEFSREMGGTIVLKPLSGSGGRNVFLLRPDDLPNANQIIEAVSRDGYIVAQEYLPAAAYGDTRLFLLNGAPLRHKGKYAAIRRVRSDGDIRSNITAGAGTAPAVIDDSILELAETIRPQLRHDGMFFVGLDIVSGKLMEINVFSPGGLESAEGITGIKFSHMIIHDLERKHEHRRNTDRHFSNKELAVL
ncbi:MAG TPA: glutathione synthase [Sedimenticola sp.]|nr:glutathione synthase [Sedimenticola sp.]